MGNNDNLHHQHRLIEGIVSEYLQHHQLTYRHEHYLEHFDHINRYQCDDPSDVKWRYFEPIQNHHRLHMEVDQIITVVWFKQSKNDNEQSKPIMTNINQVK
jgi:hypothetical protein